MSVYIFLWGAVVVFGFIASRSNYKAKYFVLFSFFLMTIVLGLRGATVGEDTKMYLNIAERVTNISWKEVFSSFPTSQWRYISYGGLSGFSERTETVYLAYCKLIMLIFHNAQAVLLITAAITNALFAKFILDNITVKQDAILAVYIYMCDAMFMNSFNTMRQILAISIAVQSIELIKKEKYKKAIACVLLAACFHQSAIVFFAADLFYLLKKKKERYIYLLVTVCALPVLIPVAIKVVSIFSSKYASYLSVSFWGAQLRGTLLLWIIIAIVLFIMIRANQSNNIDWWLIYMATIYIGVELVGMQLTVISRVAMYFRIFLVLLFPIAQKYFTKKSGQFYKIGVVMLMTVSFFSYASSPARLYTFCF